MSPWLIVIVGWPAVTSAVAGLTAHPVTDATVAAATALALGSGVLLRLRSRERPGRRSTS
ncbi:MAG: hypothetical protein ACLQU9_14455 [Acidimicrobiales bacterium]